MQPHHHVFSHQNPYHQQTEWQQHHPHAQTQYAQSQAAAAANAVAQQHQQQQYGRVNGGAGASGTPGAHGMNPELVGGTNSMARNPNNDHNPSGIFSANGEQMSEENRRVLEWIAQVLNANTRESALLELSKKREQVPELALILWHSFGVMTSLLQEIISVYPLLNPSQLTAAASNRVCNALALLQCVASHSETRGLFLGGEQNQPKRLAWQRRLTGRSAHSPLPVSLPQHHLEEPTFRVSPPDVPWCHRRSGQERQQRCYPLPPHD